MANQLAIIGGDGGDPRLSMGEGQVPVPGVIRRRLHDPDVKIEEYFYYAKIQREQEKSGLDPAERSRIANGLDSHTSGSDVAVGSDEKTDEKSRPELPRTATNIVTPQEWENASRAARNATWPSIVYLITTDILGPSNAPWAISQYGYVGGVMMYTFMGIMAFYAGWMIWCMFLKLDSDKYPMRSFGDLGFRIFGKETRHGMNILQSIQLLFNVGVIIIVNGQSLSQMSKFKLCFAVCIFIWPICGAVVGQIRTLQKFGWIANFAIWLNVIWIFMTIGVAAHSTPNYAAALATFGTPQGPIEHTVWIPSGSTFDTQLGAAMQIVYAYGGAMLYCEFMAEMRRPFDFIKAQFVAEIFIYLMYLMFGLVVYSQQGQFTYNPANQGLSPYSWQTATNAINLASGLIAAVLYGNIGIKVIYQNIVQDLMGGPELTTKAGKILWIGMVPIYWSLAFIIGSAVPQFTNVSSMVSATCIMQFTYTFPALLYFGIKVQEDAITPEEKFDPATGQVYRIDSWKDLSRWKRGIFSKRWYLKIFDFIFFLASLTTAALGMYASGTGLREDFASGHATSFSCTSPLE
ncbi:hypothetical protein BDZ45DRAFT_108747 [Acephala macrosclerotiorum]|nr:hypothetical protein BDZ45DRAFT_108747 [Acephala macrosclerotiorum]